MEYKNFLQSKNRKPLKEVKESSKHLVFEFGQKSTIHAMNRIFQDQSNLCERSFWLLILILAFAGCIYVCLILSKRFNEGSLQTVVENTNLPVYNIQFPEVAICNDNRLNWNRLQEAKERFLPNENNAEKLRLFEIVIGLYDRLQYGKFHVFHKLNGEHLHLVNDVNFTTVFDFMTWHCEELLTDCRWHHFEVNCCEIFEKSKSLNGICWHFNTLSTDESKEKTLTDSKYPWRIGSSGSKSALSLKVLINEDKHYTKDNEKGILVSITQPEVFYNEAVWIQANTDTSLDVEPVIYYFDNGTRSLSPLDRGCIFSDGSSAEIMKLPGFSYMLENCETQCRQQHLLSFCNCTMDLLFPQENFRSCTAEDLLCLAKYNDHFRFIDQPGEEKFVQSKLKGMVCKCLRNCYSLNYYTNAIQAYLPEYFRNNISYIDLDVFFRFERMMVYRTSLVVNWVDLIVSFGGIAGLFLGCSLISGIELIYFAFLEMPIFLFHELKLKLKTWKLAKWNHTRRMHHKRHNWILNNRITDVQGIAVNNSYGLHLNDMYTRM